MALQRKNDIEDIIRAAVDGVVSRVSAKIAAAIDEAAKQSAPTKRVASARLRRGRRAGRRPASRRAAEITAWTTDRRARRVPKFVIEMTGLDTKKKIVAKFGEDVTFRRGQPLPPTKQPASSSAAAPVTAKPPRIRKASGG